MNVVLVMFKDDGTSKEFPLSPGKTLVGRSEECDLRIPLPEISRKHSILMVTNNTVAVRDLGSANGTYVNNKRVTEQELAAGDHLVVGPVVFTVRVNGEPRDIKPVHTRLETRSPAVVKKPATPKPATAGAATKGEEDPISALEALAGTDDTAEMDLEGSSIFGEE
ncbi:MAG: FHA domain-containing protein [Phycisphaerae bacterium]|jgi:pSer/pThr/pTyr-binding forkhead associated (FHA) protein|nr:FHA domain-containing protein [Phycisphaerae bacterium]